MSMGVVGKRNVGFGVDSVVHCKVLVWWWLGGGRDDRIAELGQTAGLSCAAPGPAPSMTPTDDRYGPVSMARWLM